MKFFCKMFESTNEGFEDQETTLNKFSAKIREVYKKLISDSELAIDELVMLTSIETRVEELLSKCFTAQFFFSNQSYVFFLISTF